METKLKSGTCVVGIVCSDGVVLAADRQASMGDLVAVKDTKKITPLNNYIAIGTAGSVADIQVVERIMKAEISLFEIERNKRMPIESAATLLSNILYSAGGMWVGLLLAGYDEKPWLFDIDGRGGIESQKYCAVGSGSPVAYGVLEDRFEENLKTDDGVKIAIKAVKAATERDVYCGGTGIDVAVITKDGIKLIEHNFK
ncbi:MAG: proteasome subunit beta [archaeon]